VSQTFEVLEAFKKFNLRNIISSVLKILFSRNSDQNLALLKQGKEIISRV
jgi:hypothetical protein